MRDGRASRGVDHQPRQVLSRGPPRLPGAPRSSKSESRPLRGKRSLNALKILLRQRPHGDWAGLGTASRISKGIEERARHDPSPPPARRDRTTERRLAHKLRQDLPGVRAHPAHPPNAKRPRHLPEPLPRLQTLFPLYTIACPKSVVNYVVR